MKPLADVLDLAQRRGNRPASFGDIAADAVTGSRPHPKACRCETCDPELHAEIRENNARQRREARMRRAAELSQIGERFAQRTFASFAVDDTNRDAFEACRRAVRAKRVGVGMFGDVGTGKSHLAAAICNDATAIGRPAVFANVVDLLTRIRATYDRSNSGSESALIDAYVGIDVLAIDDLGKESLSDWSVRTLYAVVNARYERNLPLVVTSNSSLEDLMRRTVDARAEQNTYIATLDRVFEMTGRRWFELRGESNR